MPSVIRNGRPFALTSLDMPIFCRHLAISCLLLCPAELCGRLAPAQSSPLAADPSKEVDVAIELVAEGSLAEGQHDMQVSPSGLLLVSICIPIARSRHVLPLTGRMLATCGNLLQEAFDVLPHGQH